MASETGNIENLKAHSKRIEGLDLIRGGAITLVLLRHSWPEIFGGAGIVGVVAFFTLSGYLITGILLSDLRRVGRVDYRRFYRNRAIRLLPALLVLLLGVFLVEFVVNISGTRDEFVRSAIVALTYTGNIPGFSHGTPTLGHLWTLANEEQFYLVWPFVLYLGIRFRKTPIVVAGTAFIVLVALIGTIYLTYPDDIFRIYSLPTSWTISMIIGAGAQIYRDQLERLFVGKRATIFSIVGVSGLLGLAFFPEAKNEPLAYLLGGPLIAVLTVLIILRLSKLSRVPPVAKPLLALGTVSYAAYLWNYPVGIWLRDANFGPGWEVVAIVLTIAVAALSWFAVERPLNALKKILDKRFPRPPSNEVTRGTEENEGAAESPAR